MKSTTTAAYYYSHKSVSTQIATDITDRPNNTSIYWFISYSYLYQHYSFATEDIQSIENINPILDKQTQIYINGIFGQNSRIYSRDEKVEDQDYRCLGIQCSAQETRESLHLVYSL